MIRRLVTLRWSALAIAALAATVCGVLVAGVSIAQASVRHATSVVAIGDSIMDGHGLSSVAQSWPAIVADAEGWNLTNLAADGDGFVKKGNDGTTFTDQVKVAVKLQPEVVILSGSSNDLGVPEQDVQAAIQADLTVLHARLPNAQIIAVSPVWNQNAFPAQLVQIGADVQSAVTTVGGSYLDIGQPLLGKRDLVQGDDVHPTAAGQRLLAAAVTTGLRRAGLV